MPCPSHEMLYIKCKTSTLNDNADVNAVADAGGIVTALPVHSYRQAKNKKKSRHVILNSRTDLDFWDCFGRTNTILYQNYTRLV